MINYLFDIDGTLTPSRLPIDKNFELFFIKWMKNKNVYLITGSDKEKTVEQVGENIWKSATRVYQSCGNQVWENGEMTKENPFSLNPEMEKKLLFFLKKSNWKEHFGNHFEQRVGLVNFSIIGRNCPQNKREAYQKWDNIHHERLRICDAIMKDFPQIEASVGGQISIDIYKTGKNKSQVLDDIEGEVYFFGDKMDKGGNDYPIALRLKNENWNYKLFKVDQPTDTWKILQKM